MSFTFSFAYHNSQLHVKNVLDPRVESIFNVNIQERLVLFEVHAT